MDYATYEPDLGDCRGGLNEQETQDVCADALMEARDALFFHGESLSPIQVLERLDDIHELVKHRFKITTGANPPNVQKLRRPEPNVLNSQKAHSQIRSANEGLPPALC